MKGQAEVEFIILVSVLLAVSVIILANAFKEMELNLAVATTRSASEQIALQQQVVFYNISYSVKPNFVFLTPVFSAGFLEMEPTWLEYITRRVKAVIAPNSEIQYCSGQTEGCCADLRASDGLCFSTTRCFCVIK